MCLTHWKIVALMALSWTESVCMSIGKLKANISLSFLNLVMTFHPVSMSLFLVDTCTPLDSRHSFQRCYDSNKMRCARSNNQHSYFYLTSQSLEQYSIRILTPIFSNEWLSSIFIPRLSSKLCIQYEWRVNYWIKKMKQIASKNAYCYVEVSRFLLPFSLIYRATHLLRPSIKNRNHEFNQIEIPFHPHQWFLPRNPHYHERSHLDIYTNKHYFGNFKRDKYFQNNK